MKLTLALAAALICCLGNPADAPGSKRPVAVQWYELQVFR